MTLSQGGVPSCGWETALTVGSARHNRCCWVVPSETAANRVIKRCFDQVIDFGAEQLVVVVGYMKEKIIDYYGDEYRGVPIALPARTEGTGPCLADCRRARRRRFHAVARGQHLPGQSRGRGYPTSGAAS